MEPSSSWLCLPGNDLRGGAFIWAPVLAPPRHTKGAGSQLNWKRVAHVLHAISCTSCFLLSWGMAEQVFLKLLPHGFASRPLFCSWFRKKPVQLRLLFSFGPAGLRPARSHPSSDLSIWVSESCSLGPMALHSAAMQTAVLRTCGET